MSVSKIIPIQSQEARVKAIGRVCSVIAGFSIIDVLMYAYIKLYVLAITLFFVGIFFGVLYYLNKNGFYKISRAALIVVTNVGVLLFSAYLGFKTGIYLYLFAAPLLTYMLYDFKQKIQVYICFASYIVTFVFAYLIERAEIISPVIADEKMVTLLYSVNLIFSFLLCFILIIYFSLNNSNYIELLVQSNDSIVAQQNQLREEILDKNNMFNQLNDTLKDKELLLSEIHHRVKNNLAVISGLIELQNFYVKDAKASSILIDSKNRIKAISLLHEKLYGNKTYERIDALSYVTDLVSFIQESYSNSELVVKMNLNIENIEISIEEGLPFSLLISELITNTYKHAFVNRTVGNIFIYLKKEAETFFLEYSDDGVGFEVASTSKEISLGLNLLEAFSTQLKSVGELTSTLNNGVNFKIKFKAKVG